MTQTVKYKYAEEARLRISNETLLSGDTNAFLENKLFSTVTPLFYRERLRLTLEVSDDFKNKMALIRGIVEFTRSSRLLFKYDLNKRTIETDIHPANVGDLKSFFINVLKLVEDEIRFKKALKEVIAFESEYKRLSSSVYAALNATT